MFHFECLLMMTSMDINGIFFQQKKKTFFQMNWTKEEALSGDSFKKKLITIAVVANFC